MEKLDSSCKRDLFMGCVSGLLSLKKFHSGSSRSGVYVVWKRPPVWHAVPSHHRYTLHQAKLEPCSRKCKMEQMTFITLNAFLGWLI